MTAKTSQAPTTDPTLQERYDAVRAATRALTHGLSPEDMQVQSMADVSPTKWHLAHTTWFFETFLLEPRLGGYRPFDPRFAYLFNSYYEAEGPRHPRAQRGLVSRPSLDEVMAYRAHVDEGMTRLLQAGGVDPDLVELGLNHEQQHQELILMDIKHVLGGNPLRPAFRARPERSSAAQPGAVEFLEFPGGIREIGHAGGGFAFDNEGPRHRVFVEPFRLADRLTTCGDYRNFIEDGGYRRPELWLSDGWAAVQANGWTAPLFWERGEAGWSLYSLAGLAPVDPDEPVCHLSHYEADAFARWAGARLPTEAEWETAAAGVEIAGEFADSGRFHPAPAQAGAGLRQMFGDVWEWTSSAYLPYPSFRTAPGAVGEYNGKFMSGQMVLRGGAAVTPADHIRPTYRNFFPPQSRWAFSGLRLAKDA